MLDQLKAQMQGAYTTENLRELERMEAMLRLEHFSSGDALRLGNQIVQSAKEHGGDIIVRIIRTEDQLPIFQYVGDSKDQHNIDYALMKSNTVTATGHCSLWALVKELTSGGVASVFHEGSGCLPVGGAFPIYAGGKMAAIIMTSDLHDGMDHVTVVEAICSMQNAEVPVFSGKLV